MPKRLVTAEYRGRDACYEICDLSPEDCEADINHQHRKYTWSLALDAEGNNDGMSEEKMLAAVKAREAALDTPVVQMSSRGINLE